MIWKVNYRDIPLLLTTESDALWDILMREWLQEFKNYYFYHNYFPYFMTPAGHC